MAASHPRQIGRYEVFGELGHGGFGRVYRAYDPTVGRPVALKVLSDVSNDMLTRFRNEAKVAGNLRHNSIVTVYEYGTHDGAPFLAMEYLEGEDLHHVISSRRPLSLLDKCNIMSQVADGLLYAHNNGVIHRDMKPANIMVLHDGAVKIMDFGIARLTRTPDATRLTQEGYLIGTLRYMAPEQLASADFDARSDIFAYGVIFYELLAGRHPFEAPDAQSLMYKLSFEEPAPLGKAAPDSLQQVILKTLRKDRERRYQSLSEIKFDTEPIRIELQKARASELLLQARSLLEEESLEPAQKVVQEALALEPANTTARQLREAIQQSIQKRILQPRIEGLLSSGEEHLAGRRFLEAVQAFESALALDEGNSYIRGRVEEARALVDHAGRADQLLAEARREFEQQNLTAAYRMISEALRHDPRNPEAAEFLKTIETYAERRQAEQRVDDAIRKFQGLLLIPDYDQALAVLAPLNQDSPRIRECLERVRSEKASYERKQKFRKEMTEATDLLRSSRFDEAARRLEVLRKEFPEDREAADLLAYALREQSAVARTKAIGEAAADARARVRQNNFEGALAVLEKALEQYPGESSLLGLLNSVMRDKSAWERENAIRAAITSCESLRSERRFEEAIEAIKAALTVHGGESRLASLARQLEKEWAQERRNQAVRKISRRAEELLAAKQPEAAVETLQKGLKGTSPAPTTTKRARRRIRVLIAGGAAAASLAGGIFAFRTRRPADIPMSAAVDVPATASPSPAASPALPETPAVDSKKPDNPPQSADKTPAPARPEQLRPGKAVRLERRQVAMATVAKPVPVQVPVPAPAPPPDPKQIDAQEWAQVANSTNLDDFDSFIRNHPGSAHLEQARGRAAELRQQARARAAQQLDQTAWEKVDQKNREQLEDYLSRFPSGMHTQEARARLADAERQAAEALAAQRSREQKEQEQARHAAEQQAILGILREFEAAYNRRDLAALQRIWKALPVTTYRQQFRDAKDLTFQLQLMGQPEIAGNSAIANCTRTISYKGQSGGLQTHSEHVKLTLTREQSGWVIRAIELK